MAQGYVIKQPNGSYKIEFQELKRGDYLEVKLGNYWVMMQVETYQGEQCLIGDNWAFYPIMIYARTIEGGASNG
jgi:hypothetical protein